MKKFYTFEPKNFRIFTKMKSFLAVALLLLMAVGSVNAEEVTISFDMYGTSGTVNSYLSYTTAKNSGTTAPVQSSPQLRLYFDNSGNGNGCSLTFAISNGAVVTGLEINAVSSYTPTVKYNVDGGSDVEAMRSGNKYTISGIQAQNSLTFRNANETNTQLRITSIKITYDVACQELVQRTDNVSICEYGLPNYYNFNGKNLTEAGTYLDTIPAPGVACDTVVTLNLSVIPGEYYDTITINEGQFIVLAGDTITTSGDYDHYFTGAETSCGCDSFVALHVTVTPINTTYEEVASACVGSPYTFPLFNGLDTNIICTETYIYEFTEPGIAQGGRDSVRILYLDVFPTYNETSTDSICQGTEYQFGEGILGYHFDVDAEPGVYTDLRYTFESATGCDSIVTLTLVISPNYQDTVEATFCSNELPQNVGDITIETGKASGIYDYSFQSVAGCDSNVVVVLTVNPSYEETIVDTICESQLPYTFRGHEWTAAGSETYNETTTAGCDSIVNYTLIVNPIYSEELSDTICPTELATYEFRGHTFTEGGEFTYNETTVAGCDSVVVFNLTVIPAYNREEMDTTICVNEAPYAYYGEIRTNVLALKSDLDVTAANTAVEEAMTADAINAALLTLRNAYTTYLTGAAFEDVSINLAAALIDNPAPYANSNYWTVTNASGKAAVANAFDNGNRCAEFWNQQGHSIKQTLKATLPAGYYTLTGIAVTREGMEGLLIAGDKTTKIATMARRPDPYDGADDGVLWLNSRAGAKKYFDAGNGVNTLTFQLTEATADLLIGLTADSKTSDYWTVWRSFELTYLGTAPISVLSTQLDEAIAAAKETASTLAVPAGVAGLLTGVANDYEAAKASYSTAKQFVDAMDAIADAVEAAETAIAPTAENPTILGKATATAALEALGTDAKATLQGVIDNNATNLAACTTAAAVDTQNAALWNAISAAINSIELTGDETLNLTYLLTNPDVSSFPAWTNRENVPGWYTEQADGNSQTMTNDAATSEDGIS